MLKELWARQARRRESRAGGPGEAHRGGAGDCCATSLRGRLYPSGPLLAAEYDRRPEPRASGAPHPSSRGMAAARGAREQPAASPPRRSFSKSTAESGPVRNPGFAGRCRGLPYAPSWSYAISAALAGRYRCVPLFVARRAVTRHSAPGESLQVGGYVTLIEEKQTRRSRNRVGERTKDLRRPRTSLLQKEMRRTPRRSQSATAAWHRNSSPSTSASSPRASRTKSTRPCNTSATTSRFLQGAFADIRPAPHAHQGRRRRADAALSGTEIDELLHRAARRAYLAAEAPKAIAQSLDGVNRVTEIVLAMKAFAHPSNYDRSPPT